MFNREMFEKSLAIVADANADSHAKAFAQFVIDMDGKHSSDAVAVADAINKKSLALAVASLWDGNNFNWESMVKGVAYPFIDVEDKDAEIVKSKLVMVRDCFCLKKSKNSNKNTMSNVMLGMVAQFGLNLGMNFADSHAEAVSMLKVYTKFTDAPKVFFSENPSSNNSLEKQFQVIADSMLGKDAVKMKKCHVVHAKDSFIRANAKGYKNGNEIALLQIIVDHIRDAKCGKVYNHDSKLMGHKAPKEKNTK